MAAAATHTPEQVQFYCLDFGGGTLTSLAKLPHVGGVAGRMDSDAIRRTVAEVAGVLRDREQRFRDLAIESMRDFRQRKARLASLATRPGGAGSAEPRQLWRRGARHRRLGIDRSDFETSGARAAVACHSGPVVRRAPGHLGVAVDGDSASRQGHARDAHRAAAR